MTARLFTTALLAGLLAGLVAVTLQWSLIQGLILEAEAYESGAKVHFATPATPAAGTAPEPPLATHDDSGDSNFARFGLAFSNVFLSFVGWGLLLVAGFALAERFTRPVTASQGILWGGAGFLATALLPAIGLPPELPGMPAAELFTRQSWWLGTALAAGAALALFAYGRGPVPVLIGLALLVAPQLIGAPKLAGYGGIVPPELAAEFAARSLAEAFAGWAVLGMAAAWLWNRAPRGQAGPAVA